MSLLSTTDVVSRFEMMPHPEGGYYREIMPGEPALAPWHLEKIPKECALVYFLLEGRDFFPFHFLPHEETWHLYWGGPFEFHIINQHGEHKFFPLAHHQGAGHPARLRTFVNQHKAIRLAPGASWGLAICVRPPHHEFASIEPATRGDLLLSYPNCEEIIRQLTRDI